MRLACLGTAWPALRSVYLHSHSSNLHEIEACVSRCICACGRQRTRAARPATQRVLGPPAAALVVSQPAPPPAAPQRRRPPAALDAAGHAYALVRANDGGAVVTLDLDRTQRVRSAVLLRNARGRRRTKAVMTRPKAAPRLARVPLGEAAALILAPPAKREGVPGYFCHRLLVEQSRLAAAKKITGISDLGDRFLPLFYVDDDTGSREASGGVQAFFDPKAAELVRKEAKRDFSVREADAFVLLRRGGLDELDLVPSALMAADSKGDFVARDDAAPLEVVLELECDVANSNCVISKTIGGKDR